jgi:hypothetical protein
VVGSALSAGDIRLPYAGPAAPKPSTILGTGLALAQPNRCSFPVVLSRVFCPGCSFPGALSRVFRPGCSFPDVPSIAQRVFFPGEPSTVGLERAIHSPSEHPCAPLRPLWHVSCALCGTSSAPSVARHLCPLWHVICAICGTSSVPSVANQLCPLWHVSCALCGTSSVPSVARHLCPLWHVICAVCGPSFVSSVARHMCPLWHVICALFGTSSQATPSSHEKKDRRRLGYSCRYW